MCGEKTRYGYTPEKITGKLADADLTAQPDPNVNDAAKEGDVFDDILKEAFGYDEAEIAPLAPANLGMFDDVGDERERGEVISDETREHYRQEMHNMVDAAFADKTGNTQVVVITHANGAGGGAWGWSGNLPRPALTNWLVNQSLAEMLGGMEASALDIDPRSIN